MDSKQISIGQASLNVVDVGEGPVILLVHGFPLSHAMWKFQIEELSSRFRVIAPDLPGFGDSSASSVSPAGEPAMSMRSLADGLAALLDALGVAEPIAYCGLSMGGYIGWQFWRHHGQRVSHLIACDTRAAADSEQVRRARKISAQSVMQTGAARVADTMVQKLFHDPQSKSKQSIVGEIHQVISQTEPSSIAAGQLAMAARSDASEWISEIDIPTLFVVGQFDEITTPTEMRQNAELVRGSQFLEVANAGHMVPLENPGEFNQGLIGFLDG